MPIKLFASMGLTICALCFHLFIFVVYLSKKKFKAYDSGIFLFMFALTFLILIDECLYIYAMYAELDAHISFIPVQTLCYIYIYLGIIWFMGLIIYIFSKIKSDKSLEIVKKNRIISIVSLIVISSILFLIARLLKVEYPVGNSHLYVFAGPAVYVLYVSAIISFLIVSIGVFLRRKTIPDYQKYPIYFCLAMLLTVNIIQFMLDYDWNTLSYLFTFVITTLYFTIESQDYKLINELEQKSEEAEIAYNTKTQFLSNMSHEIRTPLNTIINISHALLHDDNITKEEIQSKGKMIQVASEELHEIINSILDISSAESNKLEIENSEYELSDLIYTIDKTTQDKSKNSNISFKIDTDANVMQRYRGDQKKIARMINSIIDSFLQFTEYGMVTLQVRGKEISSTEQEISFDIISPSNKITANEFQTLFNSFKNNDAKLEKNISNISLQLIVAREFLDLLKGDYQIIENDNGLHCSIHLSQEIVKGSTPMNNTETAPQAERM